MTLEKILTKYGLLPYYKNGKIKMAYNAVPMTLAYKVLRFADENAQLVVERYTGERYIIITLKEG